MNPTTFTHFLRTFLVVFLLIAIAIPPFPAPTAAFDFGGFGGEDDGAGDNAVDDTSCDGCDGDGGIDGSDGTDSTGGDTGGDDFSNDTDVGVDAAADGFSGTDNDSNNAGDSRGSNNSDTDANESGNFGTDPGADIGATVDDTTPEAPNDPFGVGDPNDAEADGNKGNNDFSGDPTGPAAPEDSVPDDAVTDAFSGLGPDMSPQNFEDITESFNTIDQAISLGIDVDAASTIEGVARGTIGPGQVASRDGELSSIEGPSLAVSDTVNEALSNISFQDRSTGVPAGEKSLGYDENGNITGTVTDPTTGLSRDMTSREVEATIDSIPTNPATVDRDISAAAQRDAIAAAQAQRTAIDAIARAEDEAKIADSIARNEANRAFQETVTIAEEEEAAFNFRADVAKEEAEAAIQRAFEEDTVQIEDTERARQDARSDAQLAAIAAQVDAKKAAITKANEIADAKLTAIAVEVTTKRDSLAKHETLMDAKMNAVEKAIDAKKAEIAAIDAIADAKITAIAAREAVLNKMEVEPVTFVTTRIPIDALYDEKITITVKTREDALKTQETLRQQVADHKKADAKLTEVEKEAKEYNKNRQNMNIAEAAFRVGIQDGILGKRADLADKTKEAVKAVEDARKAMGVNPAIGKSFQISIAIDKEKENPEPEVTKESVVTVTIDGPTQAPQAAPASKATETANKEAVEATEKAETTKADAAQKATEAEEATENAEKAAETAVNDKATAETAEEAAREATKALNATQKAEVSAKETKQEDAEKAVPDAQKTADAQKALDEAVQTQMAGVKAEAEKAAKEAQEKADLAADIAKAAGERSFKSAEAKGVAVAAKAVADTKAKEAEDAVKAAEKTRDATKAIEDAEKAVKAEADAKKAAVAEAKKAQLPTYPENIIPVTARTDPKTGITVWSVDQHRIAETAAPANKEVDDPIKDDIAKNAVEQEFQTTVAEAEAEVAADAFRAEVAQQEAEKAEQRTQDLAEKAEDAARDAENAIAQSALDEAAKTAAKNVVDDTKEVADAAKERTDNKQVEKAEIASKASLEAAVKAEETRQLTEIAEAAAKRSFNSSIAKAQADKAKADAQIASKEAADKAKEATKNAKVSQQEAEKQLAKALNKKAPDREVPNAVLARNVAHKTVTPKKDIKGSELKTDPDKEITPPPAKEPETDTAEDDNERTVTPPPQENKIVAVAKGFASKVGDVVTELVGIKDANSAPRGIRNNNPGNIEKGQGWVGRAPSRDSRFETFKTPEYGIRAIFKLLDAYERKHGLKSIAGKINRWAPPFENKTSVYAKVVAKAAGVGVNQPVSIRDKAKGIKIVEAIIQHENGQQPYSRNQIEKAYHLAFGGTPSKHGKPTDTVRQVLNLAGKQINKLTFNKTFSTKAPASGREPGVANQNLTLPMNGSVGGVKGKIWGGTPMWGTQRGRWHLGVDIYSLPGTPTAGPQAKVFAASDGVVTKARWHGGYGWTIEITSNTVKIDGKWAVFRYGHIAKPSLYGIKKGMQVKKGQQISHVAGSGTKSGSVISRNFASNATKASNYHDRVGWKVNAPHLHFEVRTRSDFGGRNVRSTRNPRSLFPAMQTYKGFTRNSTESVEQPVAAPVPKADAATKKGLADIAKDIAKNLTGIPTKEFKSAGTQGTPSGTRTTAPYKAERGTKPAQFAPGFSAKDCNSGGCTLPNGSKTRNWSGYRTNNPFNDDPAGWEGQIGANPRNGGNGHARFDNPVSGLRASLRNQYSYQNKKYSPIMNGVRIAPRELRSVRERVSRRTPERGRNGETAKGTKNAIAFISKRMGIDPDEDFDITDRAMALSFMKATIPLENGGAQPYSDAQMNQAFDYAFTDPNRGTPNSNDQTPAGDPDSNPGFNKAFEEAFTEVAKKGNFTFTTQNDGTRAATRDKGEVGRFNWTGKDGVTYTTWYTELDQGKELGDKVKASLAKEAVPAALTKAQTDQNKLGQQVKSLQQKARDLEALLQNPDLTAADAKTISTGLDAAGKAAKSLADAQAKYNTGDTAGGEKALNEGTKEAAAASAALASLTKTVTEAPVPYNPYGITPQNIDAKRQEAAAALAKFGIEVSIGPGGISVGVALALAEKVAAFVAAGNSLTQADVDRMIQELTADFAKKTAENLTKPTAFPHPVQIMQQIYKTAKTAIEKLVESLRSRKASKNTDAGDDIENLTIEEQKRATSTFSHTVPVQVTYDRDTGSVDFSVNEVLSSQDVDPFYSADLTEYEEELAALLELRNSSEPLVLDENGEIVFSDGTYAPITIDGVEYPSEVDTEYIYETKIIENGAYLELETGEGILPQNNNPEIREGDTFRTDDILAVTRSLVDPDETIPADEYYEYVIKLTDTSERTTNIPRFTSVSFMEEQFGAIGYRGNVLDLTSAAIEVPHQEDSNVVLDLLTGSATLIIDLATSPFSSDESGSSYALPTETTGSRNISDIERVTVYLDVAVECAESYGENAGYIYEVVVAEQPTDRIIQEARCGTGSAATFAEAIGAHVSENHDFSTLSPEQLLDKMTFNYTNQPELVEPEPDVTTEIPDQPTTTPSETEDPIVEPEAKLPNTTNTVIFETKVTNGGATIIEWTDRDSLTIRADDQLHFRWRGDDYLRCLPFLADNGGYTLTRSDLDITTGNTETEGYDIREQSGTYFIECGGQSNDEYGVDVGGTEIFVTQ